MTLLRGAPAKVVTNMQASLEIPTATSVRAVPAKLLADNRIVINNHLRRARGGKVSFTHIIGYAVVRALRRLPGDEQLLRLTPTASRRWSSPSTSTSAWPSTCPARTAAARWWSPSIKGAEQMDFARVLGRLRGHHPAGPGGQADGRRLRRHRRSA